MSQPRVSRQLAILKQSKIIKDRREGKWIYYKIDHNEYTKHLMSIISLLTDWLRTDPEFNNDKLILQKIAALKSCECVFPGGVEVGK
jgi:DNA-binding transcriptional ArsR family regulator